MLNYTDILKKRQISLLSDDMNVFIVCTIKEISDIRYRQYVQDRIKYRSKNVLCRIFSCVPFQRCVWVSDLYKKVPLPTNDIRNRIRMLESARLIRCKHYYNQYGYLDSVIKVKRIHNKDLLDKMTTQQTRD